MVSEKNHADLQLSCTFGDGLSKAVVQSSKQKELDSGCTWWLLNAKMARRPRGPGRQGKWPVSRVSSQL